MIDHLAYKLRLNQRRMHETDIRRGRGRHDPNTLERACLKSVARHN
jgi:hypothetical protein